VIEIELRRRDGSLRAISLVDDADGAQAQHRWMLNTNGYAYRSVWVDGVRLPNAYLHREIMGMSRGDGLYVDHINRDKLDNRRANLRIVTSVESRQNTPAIGGASAHRGVARDHTRGKWIAQAQLRRRHMFLGRFDSESEAVAVVRAWRKEHMPFAID
jgi:hypothetical protein